MHPNERTIHDFYGAFARLDPEGMAPCYAEEVAFDDEAFSLRGRREVMGMWRMLCEATGTQNRDAWKLEFSDVRADDRTGQAHWDAHYRFSATGRLVLNRIDAAFEFDPQGRIVRHRDRFDFWRWSRQALGAPGLLMGWTPVLRSAVRRKARANLDRYLAKSPG